MFRKFRNSKYLKIIFITKYSALYTIKKNRRRLRLFEERKRRRKDEEIFVRLNFKQRENDYY